MIEKHLSPGELTQLRSLLHAPLNNVVCSFLEVEFENRLVYSSAFSFPCGEWFINVWAWCDGWEMYELNVDKTEKASGVAYTEEGHMLNSSSLNFGLATQILAIDIFEKEDEGMGEYRYDSGILFWLSNGTRFLISPYEHIPGLTELTCDETRIVERNSTMQLKHEWK